MYLKTQIRNITIHTDYVKYKEQKKGTHTFFTFDDKKDQKWSKHKQVEPTTTEVKVSNIHLKNKNDVTF